MLKADIITRGVGLNITKLKINSRYQKISTNKRYNNNRLRKQNTIQCKIQSPQKIIKGKCYVTKDNIDTDQIIPAEYLTLVPSKPDEYEKLGSYAMIGLPDELYPKRFIENNEIKTEYSIIIAGKNFGCGSSREHAPVAIGASGSIAIVAESYARIFFRNCIATGELYPIETDERLCEIFDTGNEVEIDIENYIIKNKTSGKSYSLKDLGEAKPVIDAGGIFEYARKTGLIKTS